MNKKIGLTLGLSLSLSLLLTACGKSDVENNSQEKEKNAEQEALEEVVKNEAAPELESNVAKKETDRLEAEAYLESLYMAQVDLLSLTTAWQELRQSHEDGSLSTEDFKKAMQENVIPWNKEILEMMKQVQPRTAETRELNNLFIGTLEMKLNGFEEIAKDASYNITEEEFNQMMAENGLFQEKFLSLTKKYEIPYLTDMSKIFSSQE